MNSNQNRAEHLLYRVYYKLIIPDVLYHLGFDVNTENKSILHDFHKRMFGYKTTAGMTQEKFSHFLAEVMLFWAETKGIFVRSKKDQPIGIEQKGFTDMVLMPDGTKKRVWDLL